MRLGFATPSLPIIFSGLRAETLHKACATASSGSSEFVEPEEIPRAILIVVQGIVSFRQGRLNVKIVELTSLKIL